MEQTLYEQLSDLNTEILAKFDKRLQKQLGEIFVEDSEPLMKMIQKSISDKDSESLLYAAHTLKGTCAEIGAERLRKISERIQHQAEENNHEGLEVLFESLENAYQQLLKKLDTW
ncbi:Hpt domain-containing protein [Deltaproteobacteria bacterium TL4]